MAGGAHAPSTMVESFGFARPMAVSGIISLYCVNAGGFLALKFGRAAIYYRV
jgi:hypothetical protein